MCSCRSKYCSETGGKKIAQTAFGTYQTITLNADTVPTISSLKISIQRKNIFFFVGHHSTLLVLSNFLLKEVCLAFQRNVFHEVKRVLRIENLKQVVKFCKYTHPAFETQRKRKTAT
jgi:hypothetical protein